MKKIVPVFNDEKDRMILVITLISSIFFMFIPSLLVSLFAKEYMSESSYNVAKSIFNFELLLFLVSLIFMIPVLGWILGFILAPLMLIYNAIIMIINLCALAKGSETKIPVLYEFL